MKICLITKLKNWFKRKKKEDNPLDPNYFLSVDDKTLDFLENDAEKCISEVNTVILRLKANSFQLLNLLIIGVGSGFILLTQMKNINYLAVGLASFIILWSGCAIYMALSCLSTTSRYLSPSKPEYLYLEGYKEIKDGMFQTLKKLGYEGDRETLPILRRMRLHNLSLTIDQLLNLNNKLAFRFNMSLQIAIISPITAIICAIIAFYYL